MKNIKIKFCIILVLLPNLIKAGCSFFEPLENYDASKDKKLWYAVRRYENGPEENTTCQILNLATSSNSRTLYYADGSSLVLATRTITPEPGCTSGKIKLVYLSTGNVPTPRYITYTDYDTILVVRSCYNDEDYLWIYSSKKHPCKKTRETIDRIIKEQKLDARPIFKNCKCDIKKPA